MKTHRVLMAALACALLLPLAAEAQVTYRITQRGVLGIMTEAALPPGVEPTERVIVQVLPGSPAARAGVMAGDTLISINRVAATEQVMSAPFEPGDTVVLRVRRGGREHDFTLVAAERTAHFQSFTAGVLPDSIRRQIEVIMENVRLQADTLHLRNLRIERQLGDSAIVFRFGDDSTRVLRVRPLMEHYLDADSVRARVFRLDSLGFRMLEADSMQALAFRMAERSRILADSFQVAEGWRRVFPHGDSVPGMRPMEIFTSGMFVGMRAVAGAELSELNPGLAEYFGVAEGVLVLNAREGTPAERAGMRAGDVIVGVNDTAVGSIAALRKAFDAAPAGTMRVRVLRHGRPLDLSLPARR